MSDSDCHEAIAESVKDDDDAVVAFLLWVLYVTRLQPPETLH